jgi:hypothetical protein
MRSDRQILADVCIDCCEQLKESHNCKRCPIEELKEKLRDNMQVKWYKCNLSKKCRCGKSTCPHSVKHRKMPYCAKDSYRCRMDNPVCVEVKNESSK